MCRKFKNLTIQIAPFRSYSKTDIWKFLRIGYKSQSTQVISTKLNFLNPFHEQINILESRDYKPSVTKLANVPIQYIGASATTMLTMLLGMTIWQPHDIVASETSGHHCTMNELVQEKAYMVLRNSTPFGNRFCLRLTRLPSLNLIW